jgi:hypothetical protein
MADEQHGRQGFPSMAQTQTQEHANEALPRKDGRVPLPDLDNEGCCGHTDKCGGVTAQSAASCSWWQFMSVTASILWVLAAVLFYMARFVFVVWGAGARGIYGL